MTIGAVSPSALSNSSASNADTSGPARIYVVGYPSYVGGADTELWHTLRLWSGAGIDVQIIPTWHAQPDWKARLDGIGVRTHQVAGAANFAGEIPPTMSTWCPGGTTSGPLAAVPGLRGSTVVSFCNGEFLEHAAIFRSLGCRIVWVNCMTWIFPKEIAHYEKFGPFDGYVFQSEFQRRELLPKLAAFGVTEDRCRLIRGAFAFDEFPFRPLRHCPREPFVFGRIARPDLDKWSSNLWPIYRAVQYASKRAKVMAWSPRLTQKCGPPPEWGRCLPANAEPAQKFLGSLHCMFPINGGAKENWPRSGLEAMAGGVPIVAQREWGWCEMVEHGVSGFLGGDDCELAHFAAMLAHDEELRLHMAERARQRLVSELAEPRRLAEEWKEMLFGGVATDNRNGSVQGIAV